MSVLLMLGSGALAEGRIEVPSGQEITFVDAIWDTRSAEGRAVRFRFLAPAIARDKAVIEFLQAEEDMAHLCEVFALPSLQGEGALPDQVIISLSDRPIEFGTANPEATQFFDAYRPDSGSCIWEGF